MSENRIDRKSLCMFGQRVKHRPAQEGQRFRHQLEQINDPDSGWHEVWEEGGVRLTNRKEEIVHLLILIHNSSRAAQLNKCRKEYQILPDKCSMFLR